MQVCDSNLLELLDLTCQASTPSLTKRRLSPLPCRMRTGSAEVMSMTVEPIATCARKCADIRTSRKITHHIVHRFIPRSEMLQLKAAPGGFDIHSCEAHGKQTHE